MNYKLLILTTLIIGGCASTGNNEAGIKETLKSNLNLYEESQKANKANDTKTYADNDELRFLWNNDSDCMENSNCPFKDERKYLKKWPPDYGLALSGGGTRSSTFSIGVLKALHDLKKLKDLDVISGVSGGAYAAYWYFSQIYYMDKVKNGFKDLTQNPEYDLHTIFRTKQEYPISKQVLLTNLDSAKGYRFQRALEESSEIMSYRHDSSILTPILTKLQFVFELFFQGLSTPVYWVTNSLFDWELNITPFFYFYKDGLDRTYGFVPLDYSLEHFANSNKDKFFQVPNMDAEPLLMDDFVDFFKNTPPKNPYFIINTTGVLDAQFVGHKYNKNATENRVFEFTPWGCHSTLIGINKQNDECKDFRFNSPQGYRHLDLAKIVAISGAAVDGKVQSMDVDGNPSQSSFWLDSFLNITHLNLGYHIDNPNASTKHKILHKLLPWPLYLADDALSNEESTSGIYLSDGGHSENLAVFPLIRRGVKNIYLVDAEQDGLSVFEGAKRLNKELRKYELELCFKQDHPLDVSNTENSVFNATVEHKGHCNNNNSNNKSDTKPISAITYIKLSAPSKYIETTGTAKIKLPYSVKSYIEQHPKFPHESTVDIFYSREQFRAYRDLGYKVTRCWFDKDSCLTPEYSQVKEP